MIDIKKRRSISVLFWIVLIFYMGMGNLLAQDKNIIIAHGELFELPLSDLKKFTVINREIVNYRFNPETKKVMLKGKQLGFTELVVWRGKDIKENYRIYVLSKKQHMNIVHLAQVVESLGLQAEISGPLIIVKGVLKDNHGFELLKQLAKKNIETLHFQGELDPGLRNRLIAEIYDLAFREYVDNISCDAQLFSIYCRYPETNPPGEKLIKYLAERFDVQFIPVRNQLKKKNFRAKLKVIQIEKLDGQELNFGLDKISGSLGEIYGSGVVGIMARNQFFLNTQNVDISTLAEPESIIQIDSPTLIQVGAEVPFEQLTVINGVTHNNTSWKFAGLKIDLSMKQVGDDFQIHYETEFTRPQDDGKGVSGSKEKSSATIAMNRPLKLFEIGFKTTGQNISAMPWLQRIPVLGELFKSKSDKSTYKKITGVIVVEQYE